MDLAHEVAAELGFAGGACHHDYGGSIGWGRVGGLGKAGKQEERHCTARVKLHGMPLQRRKPHSPTKHASAKANIAGVCHIGKLQLSMMGACRWGRSCANACSLSAATICPPVLLAIVSSNSTFGARYRNSSAAKSVLQPPSA